MLNNLGPIGNVEASTGLIGNIEAFTGLFT